MFQSEDSTATGGTADTVKGFKLKTGGTAVKGKEAIAASMQRVLQLHTCGTAAIHRRHSSCHMKGDTVATGRRYSCYRQSMQQYTQDTAASTAATQYTAATGREYSCHGQEDTAATDWSLPESEQHYVSRDRRNEAGGPQLPPLE